MKGLVVRKFKVITIDGKMFCNFPITEFGIDENIENFLRILFYGNW